MDREGLVCAACGKHFHTDDFFEELGELVACPYCGSFDMEIEPLGEETGRHDEPGSAREAHAA